MALQDFWINVLNAAGPIVRQAGIDSPKLDPTKINGIYVD